jgi:glycosyltransferase involved in cell wall biosynthesis
MPTICLNSIVKNEGAIILRMLKSVENIIDTYCICDTGSTDNTIELIKNFFDERHIHGLNITAILP